MRTLGQVMSVQLQLDRPHAHFTNLDVVTGKVILKLVADETVSSIVVKLEGESKSRLAGPRITYSDARTRKPEVEVHKVTDSRMPLDWLACAHGLTQLCRFSMR